MCNFVFDSFIHTVYVHFKIKSILPFNIWIYFLIFSVHLCFTLPIHRCQQSSCCNNKGFRVIFLCTTGGPTNGKYTCPKIYFNHRCFSGPYLNKGRIAELPQCVGPGNCVLVLKEVNISSDMLKTRQSAREFRKRDFNWEMSIGETVRSASLIWHLFSLPATCSYLFRCAQPTLPSVKCLHILHTNHAFALTLIGMDWMPQWLTTSIKTVSCFLAHATIVIFYSTIYSECFPCRLLRCWLS